MKTVTTTPAMKHSEAIAFLKGLMGLKGLKGLQLNHMIEKNIDRLKVEIGILRKQENVIYEIIKDYEKERVELNKKYATVDGKVMTKMNGLQQEYVIPKDQEKDFTKELNELMAKYADQIKEHDEKLAEFKIFLDKEESKFRRMGIPMALLPDDITTEYFRLLKPLINDLPSDEEEETNK